MRRSNEQTMKEAINELLETYRLKEKLSEVRLINSWEKTMGTVISKRTEKLFIKDRKLYIKLNSAVLREELSFAKNKILEMICKEAGEKIIDEVVIL